MRLTSSIKNNIVFCISVTGAFILHLCFAWLPLDRLEGFTFLWSKGPLIDDSYIIFKISQEVADWFLGVIPSPHLTSGFQPLIALLYTPFFQLFWNNKEIPIHCALSLNALFGFWAYISLYCLMRKIVSRTIATFLVSVWIWSPYVMNQTINGMETPLALLLLTIILNYYFRINQPLCTKSSSWCLLGLLIGIGFWARVDLALAGIAIALDQFWYLRKDDRHLRGMRLQNLIICGITALAIASPWMIFTLIQTGNIIPISGKGVHHITSVTFDYRNPGHPGFPFMMFDRFKEEFLILQPLAALFRNIFWQLFVTSLSLAGFIFAIRNRKLRDFLRPLWIFQSSLLIAYIVFIGGFWHLNRYLYPVYTLMLFLHAVTLGYLESKIRWKKLALSTILSILFIPFALSYSLEYYTFFSKLRPSRYLAASRFVETHTPSKSTIGTFQSGAIGYWLDNEVINLDGVINEEVFSYLQNKTIDTYLNEKNIDYLVEEVYLFKMWDHYLEGKLSKNYTKVAVKPGRGWYQLGIYKRKRPINN